MRKILTVLAATVASLGLAVATAPAAHASVTKASAVFRGADGKVITTAKPGEKVSLSVDAFQAKGDLDNKATVLIRFKAGSLTFTGNGDGSATCTHAVSRVECTYTDFAHTVKSDHYNFTLSGDLKPGDTVKPMVKVTTGDTSANTTASLSVPEASPSPTPTESAGGGEPKWVPSTMKAKAKCRVSKSDRRERWTLTRTSDNTRKITAIAWVYYPRSRYDAHHGSDNPRDGWTYLGGVSIGKGKASRTITTPYGGGLAVHYWDGHEHKTKLYVKSSAKHTC